MKVALIMPPWLPEDIFPDKTSKSQVNYWQPLGLLYLGAYLKREGHSVKFFDGSFHSLKEISGELKEYQPDLAGIYANTPLWKKAVATAEEIKKTTQAFVAVGGPYPTSMGEKTLVDSEAVDAFVIGEGEIIFTELADMLEAGKSLHGVKGLIFKDKGKVFKNPDRKPLEDLDQLPFPARELLEDKNMYIPPEGTYRKKPVAIVITSRGCDRKCIFCSQLDRERKIRYRSVENVLEEIELLLEQGYREIRFLDDNFAADYNRAMKIAGEIRKRRLEFPWFFSSRVDTIDDRLLQECRRSGAWSVFFGAESGVQRNLNILRKGISLQQIEVAVKAAKQAGLKVTLPFIFGIPGEKYEDALETINFAIKLEPDVVNFHTMTPFPGTELYERAEEFGKIEGELENFTFEGASFIPKTLKRSEIEELRRIAFRKFYARPEFILRKLLEVRTASEFRALVRGVKSLFWIAFKEDALKIKRKFTRKSSSETCDT
ncbi:(Dimethylallyl)adenosine tRNA methylthiotransferase MiaB [archaeon]|nr:(Dimethylallyl)adenosine tRNA methylthiotransferase MiaB [archaeon]